MTQDKIFSENIKRKFQSELLNQSKQSTTDSIFDIFQHTDFAAQYGIYRPRVSVSFNRNNKNKPYSFELIVDRYISYTDIESQFPIPVRILNDSISLYSGSGKNLENALKALFSNLKENGIDDKNQHLSDKLDELTLNLSNNKGFKTAINVGYDIYGNIIYNRETTQNKPTKKSLLEKLLSQDNVQYETYTENLSPDKRSSFSEILFPPVNIHDRIMTIDDDEPFHR